MSQQASHYRAGPVAPGIAFVTGGARGIGNAIAVAFAQEGSRGVALVDVANDETFAEGKAAVEKYGVKCITIRADVTNEQDVERAVAECVAEFGRIDYAANFAGIVGPIAPIVDTDIEHFKRTLDVNTIGVWLCCKHEMKQMLKQDSIAVEDGRAEQRGSIVNCGSVNSSQTGPMFGAYTTAKHAVPGITKTAALEGRPHGIRVNTVSPGFIDTRIGESIIHAPNAPPPAPANDGATEFVVRQGRIGQPREVADVVVLLSVPRMSLVNGANLAIDNGFTINETNS